MKALLGVETDMGVQSPTFTSRWGEWAPRVVNPPWAAPPAALKGLSWGCHTVMHLCHISAPWTSIALGLSCILLRHVSDAAADCCVAWTLDIFIVHSFPCAASVWDVCHAQGAVLLSWDADGDLIRRESERRIEEECNDLRNKGSKDVRMYVCMYVLK